MISSWTLIVIVYGNFSFTNVFLSKEECVKTGDLVAKTIAGNVRTICYESNRVDVQ